MSMHEFVSRFAAQNEKSVLFETLRRVGGLDRIAMLAATSPSGWIEWPPVDTSGDSSGIGFANA